MSKLFRKRIVFPIIGAVALVFSLAWALVSTPKTYAIDDYEIDSNIVKENMSKGSWGNWTWTGMSVENDKVICQEYAELIYNRNIKLDMAPFQFVADRYNAGIRVIRNDITIYNGVRMVREVSSGWEDAHTFYFNDPEEMTGGPIHFILLPPYDTKEGKDLTGPTGYPFFYIKLCPVAQKVFITAGTGIKNTYLSSDANATSGKQTESKFEENTKVYAYVTLKAGYKHDSTWTRISATDDVEDAIYRVGSTTVEAEKTYDFGTFNATPKTKKITLNNNGGVGSQTVDLTYDQAASAPSTGVSKENYTFVGWNSLANKTGKSYSTSLSVDNVNEIVLSDFNTLYAVWKITPAGVMELINQIGNVEYSSQSKAKIDAAQEAYDSLEQDEKAQVTNLSILLDAEESYDDLLYEFGDVSVNGSIYPTIQDALNAAKDGDVIALREDLDLSNEHFEIDKNLSINVGGHVLTLNDDESNPSLVITQPNTVLTLTNNNQNSGGVKGKCFVGKTAPGSQTYLPDSYVNLSGCRLDTSAEAITGELADITKVGPGYELANINPDGSPDENGFVSITKPLPEFDISNLDKDYIVPDGQVLTGELHNPVKISIHDGATVTLKDLSINTGLIPFTDENFAGITCLGDAELIIKGNNDVMGFKDGAGIFVPEGHTLTIDGDGILYSDGRDGAAGIGGNANTNSGNIIINGGNINAIGGANAAGIGGGYSKDNDLQSGNITVNGGYIHSTATDAAGIGSAVGEACGDITINGGFVEANSSWSSSDTFNCGSGIGSGKDGSCGAVTITDNIAYVRATARDKGKEIGGKYSSLDIANSLTFERKFQSIYYSHKNTVIIDGQVVNDSNSSGEGWSYDKDTNTLTLDGYKYEGSGKVYSNFTNYGGVFIAAISYDGEDDFIINLIGENTIVVTQDGSPFDVCGIHSAGNESAGIKFIGNGSLSISFTGENPESYAIAAGSSVTIDGPTIVANGGKAINESAGIYVRYDGLNVISGSLIATASECSGSHNESYGINSTGSKITFGENTKSVIASGYRNAISYETVVVNAIEGIGWTDVAGTEGETAIEVSTTGAPTEGFKYISFIGITPEDVIAFINDIGDVEYTDVCKEKIDKARDAYDFLKDDEKAIVTNYDTLLAAEENYGKVDEVVGKINAIGDVEYTDESKALIDAARSAYDALTDAQKAIVPNIDVLKAKEADYKDFDDHAKAEVVNSLIDEIGEFVNNVECEEKVSKAKEAYDALTDDQKEIVDDAAFDKLESYYVTFDVIRRINSIGEVEYTYESETLIKDAREAYNALTDEEKELVGKDVYSILLDSEDEYKGLDSRATAWVVIFLIFVYAALISGVVFLFFLLFYKRDKKEKQEKTMSVSLLPLIFLTSHYADGQFVTLYVLLGLAIAVWIAVLVIYILKKKGIIMASNVSNNTSSIEDKPNNKKEVLTPEQKEEKKQKAYLNKTIECSEMGIQVSKAVSYEEDENGIEAVGIVYNEKSRVYMFGPKNEKLNIGDVVIVLDQSNSKRMVPIVMGNKKISEEYIIQPFKDILEVVYRRDAQNDQTPEKQEEPEALPEEPIQEKKVTEEEIQDEPVEEAQEKPFEEVQEEPSKVEEEETEDLNEEELEEAPIEAEEEDLDSNVEEEETVTVTDETGHVFQVRYNKSFIAKMSQASDELKEYYNQIKNCVLSYKKTNSRVSWTFDSINIGRTQAMKFAIRGKTLCVYYALDEVDGKYKVETTESKKYAAVPKFYRIKNDRRCEYAKELVDILMRKLHIEKGKESNEDFKIPFEETNVLVEKGLIKETKTEVKN